jgi:hypothetical protein
VRNEINGEFFHEKDLKSFAIGLKGSPDLIAARKVADHLGTDHYEFTFTVQEGIDAIPDVVSSSLISPSPLPPNVGNEPSSKLHFTSLHSFSPPCSILVFFDF